MTLRKFTLTDKDCEMLETACEEMASVSRFHTAEWLKLAKLFDLTPVTFDDETS